MTYLLVPFVAWFIAGGMKFVVNSVRNRRLAFDLIGYGGLPSTHAAIASSPLFLVMLREGVNHPVVAVGTGLVFVVLLDATSLRRQIGRQATVLNRLTEKEEGRMPLRERMGHTRLEVLAGLAVGLAVAVSLHYIFDK